MLRQGTIPPLWGRWQPRWPSRCSASPRGGEPPLELCLARRAKVGGLTVAAWLLLSLMVDRPPECHPYHGWTLPTLQSKQPVRPETMHCKLQI